MWPACILVRMGCCCLLEIYNLNIFQYFLCIRQYTSNKIHLRFSIRNNNIYSLCLNFSTGPNFFTVIRICKICHTFIMHTSILLNPFWYTIIFEWWFPTNESNTNSILGVCPFSPLVKCVDFRSVLTIHGTKNCGFQSGSFMQMAE
jgi:hypothetical protein